MVTQAKHKPWMGAIADDVTDRAVGPRSASTYDLLPDGLLGDTTIPYREPDERQYFRRLIRCAVLDALQKAAAPDLLAACEGLAARVTFLETEYAGGGASGFVAQARAAIAKARKAGQ